MVNLRLVCRFKGCFKNLYFLQYPRHYSTVDSTDDSYAKYLVDSLGLSHQQALSISNKLFRRRNKPYDSAFVENANSVVTLFRHHGFHHTVITTIMSKHPRLLTTNARKTLKPKFVVLQDQGFSPSHVIRVISRRPIILLYGLKSTILPVLLTLRQVMGSVGNVVSAIERFSKWHFRPMVRCLLPNVALLTSYGVPIELIREKVLDQPGCFVQSPEVFKEVQMNQGFEYCTSSSATDSYARYLADSLGFSRQQALSISNKLSLRRRNKVIDYKFVDNANSVVTLFSSLGFCETNIRKIVSRVPNLLASDINETLKPKIRTLQDEDFSAPDIIRVISTCPEILLLGLESTILPVIHILKQVMGSVGNVVNTMEKLNELYFHNIVKHLLPNVALLSSYGVPIELIKSQLLYKPWYLLRNPEVFKDVVIRDDKNSRVNRDTPANHTYANYFVDSLGFSQQYALSISIRLYRRRGNKVIDSKFVENANSVVGLFHNYGFHEIHVREIVSKEPKLLASKADKTLKPKIMLLQDESFSGSDVIRVISLRPSILLCGLESTLLPVIQTLRQVLGSDCNVINSMERLPKAHFCSVVKCLLPNVALLSSYGVPIELIRKHIPYALRCYVQNLVVFKDVVVRVEKNLGITRDSRMFLHGINMISRRSEETIESKCGIFKSFGWTQFDIETFIMKSASCFNLSDERFKKKLDFLMNVLQLKPAYLTSHIHFMISSLEKTIEPRHKILLILEERGLFKKSPSFYSVIRLSEPRFLKRFVLPFKDVHQAYATLTGSSVEMLTQESAVRLN